MMWPVLLSFSGKDFYSYGLAIAMAALIGGVWAWRARPPGLFELPQFLWICILTTLGAAWGARLAGETGSLSSTGVPLVVGPLVFGYCLLSRLDWRCVFDHLLPFAVFGAAFQRSFGCFLGGCCRGQPSDAWTAVHFPGGSEPVHPTQLYLGLLLFLVFFMLRSLPATVPGGLALLSLGLYGFMSSLVSPLRTGLGEPVFFGLTAYGLAHAAAALGGLSGFAWLVILERRRKAPAPRALGAAS